MTKESDSTQDEPRIIFENIAPEDKEWTAHINILNKWTGPDKYLREILQYARSGEFYPADMHVDLIKQVVKSYTDKVIGPDDPVQLASDAPGHIRYIQQVERNKLRSEQRKRNKA